MLSTAACIPFRSTIAIALFLGTSLGGTVCQSTLARCPRVHPQQPVAVWSYNI
jgi:hypothetical protein